MMATRHAPAQASRPVTTAMGAPRVPGFDVPLEGPPPPVSRPRNHHEENARERKVAYLVLEAEALGKRAGCTLVELISAMECWADQHWTQLAIDAGQKPPSPETRAQVLGRLRARAARQTEAPPSYVTRFFVVRRPDPRYAWKYDIGASEGYATRSEAEGIVQAELARGVTTGRGEREEIWVEPRQVQS